MTSFAEGSDPDTGEAYFGLMFTNSSSDEEETCVQNSDVEEKIFYTPISGRSRFLSIKEAEVKSMSFMQNNYSERLSIDEDNSEEDQLKTMRRLKPEKKLKIQKRGFKRQQTDERGSPKKNTATSKTQRPSRQLSAASSIAKDNSEEDQLKTKLLKPEKKLKAKKMGFKRRQTDERGSPKTKREFKERTVSDNSGEDQLKTKLLKLEKKLKSQKRGFKRRQTAERGSPKTKREFKERTVSDNSEEDHLKTKLFKPEKKLKSQKRGFKRRQTDERVSPKRKREFKERTVSETNIPT